ncbi:MAG: hypothetical protein H6506_02515 [Calditrichaeota bacterium]|nr:hypothetical protein [Calditrichota bacterium]MCB9391506.1 hypothetical protein [Calditrichota bacterium]
MNKRSVKIMAMLLLAASVMGMGRKEAKNQDPPAPISGVTGRVEIWEGNFMPPIEAERRASQITPGANLRVRLHEPVRGLPGAMVDSVASAMVFETMTDDSGDFTIPAQEGTYSLFVEDSEGWYANSWDGAGIQGAVVVEPKKMTEILIKNTRKATF